MLQVIAICSCISAVCLWCGFVSVCCPRIFNRVSKLSGRQKFGCSRRPEDEVQNRRTEVSENGNVIEETKEKIVEEDTTNSVKSPSRLGDGSFVETINAKRNSSSLIKIRGENENKGIESIIDNESQRSSKANSVAKKDDGIFSEAVDSDREKVTNKREFRLSKQVDNYTSITSTLSAFSKTSIETSLTNSNEEKESVKI